MSAGKFIDSKYQTDGDTVVPIRIQPETVTTWNPVPAAAVAAGYPSAAVSKGRREVGIQARLARFKWKGAVPEGYDPNGILTIPILTLAALNNLVKNTDYTYLGNTVNLVGKTKETIR